MIGKDGIPTLSLEIICDLNLWIWSFQFGVTGLMNDLNGLRVSDHSAQVLSGTFPPEAPSPEINGTSFEWYCYLIEGIYPQWRVFVKSLSGITSKKENAFCQRQEAVQKAVERAFGVWFRQFKILFLHSKLWSAKKIGAIARAAVIIHNMIVGRR